MAEFFGVTEYEIRKAIKLTQLIPTVQDILENNPRRLNLAAAELIADYDAPSQEAFGEICTLKGCSLNKSIVQYIVKKCPPPTAGRQQIFDAWQAAREETKKRQMASPKKITFDRKKFAPYLDKLGNEQELEKMFLEFLQKRIK